MTLKGAFLAMCLLFLLGGCANPRSVDPARQRWNRVGARLQGEGLIACAWGDPPGIRP
jgi:hypothetical protein